jgi:hypothetical protein
LFEIGDWSSESGEHAMNVFLALPKPPTAVFAVNDLMAIGAMEAVQKAGHSVPEDVAVLGFDDIPPADVGAAALDHDCAAPDGDGASDGGRLSSSAFLASTAGAGRRFEVPCRLTVRESA